MEFIIMNKRVGSISMLELYIPLAGPISSRRRIPIHFLRDNSTHSLLIEQVNKIPAIGEIHVCGGYHEYLGIRGNILSHQLKFSRVGGGFNMGCDGNIVEIATVGNSVTNVTIPVEEFLNDDESVMEALFETTVYAGSDMKYFFEGYISKNFDSDMKYVRGIISDHFKKN